MTNLEVTARWICCPMCDREKCVYGANDCDAAKWVKERMVKSMTDRTISLAAAIEEIEAIVDTMSVCISMDECKGMRRMKQSVLEKIKALPSTHPESCEGCKWEDSYGYGECHHCRRTYGDMYDKGETP